MRIRRSGGVLRWKRIMALGVLLAFLPTLVQITGIAPVPEAHAAPSETRTDLWSDLGEVLILEPFPEEYPLPDAEAELRLISQGHPAIEFAVEWPGHMVPPDFEEASVALSVAAVEPAPGASQAIHTGEYLVTEPVVIPWNGAGFADGLYLWQSTIRPIKPTCKPADGEGEGDDPAAPPEGGDDGEPPQPCAPNFDPTPVESEPAPLIIDRIEPVALGLHSLTDGWVGVEVKDQVSGVARVDVALFPAGGGGGGSALPPIELADHPRHALVQIPLPSVAGQDLIARITVTDLAGNQGQSLELPIHPVLRSPQLGSGGPWPAAGFTVGGQPQQVNLVTGNALLSQVEFSLSAHSLSLPIVRSYNHQVREQGMLGWGWRLSLETDLRLWPDGRVTWNDASGTAYIFQLGAGEEARPVVDGIGRAWPRLRATADGYRLRMADGSATRFDVDGKVAAHLDHLGQERITYTRQDGRLTQVTASSGQTVALAYGANGLLARLTLRGTDGKSEAVSFAYEGSTLVQVTGLDGQVATFGYDAYHRLTRFSLPLDGGATPLVAETQWEYGGENRLTYVVFTRSDEEPDKPGERVQEFRQIDYQSEAGQPTALVVDPLGATTFRWDALGRPQSQARPLNGEGTLWQVEEFTYQGHNLTRYLDPVKGVTQAEYNEQDDLTLLQLPDQSKQRLTYSYEADGRVKEVQRQDLALVGGRETEVGRTTESYADGRLVRSSLYDGQREHATSYAYDANGLLTRATDPYGYVTRYDYNPQGLLAQVTDWPIQSGEGVLDGPESLWTRWTYDGRGRVRTESTRLTGTDVATTEYTYEPDRLTITQRQPAGALASESGKDFGGLAVARDTKTVVTLLRSYQPGLRPVSVTETYLNGAPEGEPTPLVTTYTYNNAGQMVEAAQGEERLYWHYDAVGNLTTQSGPDWIDRYTYDTAGRLNEYQQATGAYVRYAYDPMGRLVEEVAAYREGADGTGSEVVQAVNRYGYDALSRPTLQESTLAGTQRYTYEPSAQGFKVLQRDEQKEPISGQSQITEREEQYDRLGRLTLRRVGSDRITYEYAVDQPRVTARVAQAEVGGSLREDQVLTYRLDGRGRAVAQSLGEAEEAANTIRFGYNGLDQVGSIAMPTDETGAEQHQVLMRYDGLGRLYRMEAGENSYRYSYSLQGGPLTAQWWTGGQQTGRSSVAYDGAHQASSLTYANPSGSTQYTYQYTNGRLSGVAGGGRPMVGYAVNEVGQLTGTNRAGERPAGYGYDPFGRTRTLQTPTGQLHRFDWTLPGTGSGSSGVRSMSTAGGRYSKVHGGYLFTHHYPDGSLTQQVVNGRGQVVAQVDNLGRTTRYEYDDQGRLKRRTDDKGNTISFTYDAMGRVLTETDARGSTTRYRYEENGLQVVKTDPEGNETAVRLNLRGKPLAVTDANGNTSRYAYNAQGKLTEITSAEGNVTQFRYDAAGLVTAVVDPRGVTTRYTRDAMGRITAITDGNGETERYAYNPWGQVTRHTNREGQTTTYAYNDAGRLVEKRDPKGNITRYSWDDGGQHVATRDAAGNETTYTYNSRGWLTQIVEPGHKVTRYDYDLTGRRTYQRDGEGNEVRFAYDELGRLVREEFGSGLWIAYEYDANGNLVSQTDSRGSATTYAYDRLNRVVGIERSDGTWVGYTYDGVGNLLAESGPAGTTHYSYTPGNRIERVNFPDGSTTEYRYDPAGNVEKVLQDGKELDYTYDQTNRVTEMTDGLGYVYRYEYDRDGYVTKIHLPNGLTTHIEYDERHRVTRQWTEGAGGTVTEGRYDYEERGLRTEALEDGRGYGYAYDGRGQMAEVITPRGDLIRYYYDGAGNLVQREAVISGEHVDFVETISVDDLMAALLLYIKGETLPLDELEEAGDGPNGPKGNNGNGNGKGDEKGEPKGNEKGNSNPEVKGPKGAVLAEARLAFAGDLASLGGLVAAKEQGNAGKGSSGKETPPGQEKGNSKDVDPSSGNGQGSGPDKEVPPGQQKGDEKSTPPGQQKGDEKPVPPGQQKGDEKPVPPGQQKGDGKDLPPGQAKNEGERSKKIPPGQTKLKLTGTANALLQGKGKKLGLLKKLGLYEEWREELGLHPGLEQNLLSVIDNLVNGEYALPPGEKDEMFALVREVAAGYTVVGTTYSYNDKNQLVQRHNLVRDEEHRYSYDARGNMTNNGRSQYIWNDENQLIEVRFPDGEGVWYTYDAMGRRTSRTTFNAQEKGQHPTYFEYEGSSWRVVREKKKDGETTAAYTYDLRGRPLTITVDGATYWYLYNAHGDVVALTDANGTIQARYEYDEWGRLFAMYNARGQVKDGYGTIGDIGTGPARPVIGSPVPGTEDWEPNVKEKESGNNGNGKGQGPGSNNGKGQGKEKVKEQAEPERQPEAEPTLRTFSQSIADLLAEAADALLGEIELFGVIGEPDELVKLNPYRYAGYRFDRETSHYYLQARYYDSRLARFLSQDTWPGDVRQPLTLNRYAYAVNSPANWVDPSGYVIEAIDYGGGSGGSSSLPTRQIANSDPDIRLGQIQAFFAKYGQGTACSGSQRYGCGQAVVDFTIWELGSGRLAYDNYWVVVNTAMVQDMLDADYNYQIGGDTSDVAVMFWMLFIETPSPQLFWSAHSLSLLKAHYSVRAQWKLALENPVERAFIKKVVVPAALTVGPSVMVADGGMTQWIDVPGDWSWYWDPSSDGVDWFTDNVYSWIPYVPPGVTRELIIDFFNW